MNKPCAQGSPVRVVPVNEMDEWIVCKRGTRLGGLHDLGAQAVGVVLVRGKWLS